MAPAACPELASPDRRREILAWHAGLSGKSPQQILGVPHGADPEAVRAAFVALVKRFHPDSIDRRDPELRERLQEIFIRVAESYRELEKRPTPARPAPKPAPPPRPPDPKPPEARPAPPAAAETARARVAEALQTAIARLAEGDTTSAVSALHEVLRLADDGERRRIRILLARAYVSDPRWRRYGASLLEDMVRESPHDAEALATLGAFYHREGLVARAEATLRRALATDPRHVEARAYLRAVTAARRKRDAPEEERGPERRGLVARLLSRPR
jgi:tetratricopeptide (TPR) repeat protein